MNPRQHGGVSRPEAILVLLALAILLTGVLRFIRLGSFSVAQAGYCLLSTLASVLILFILDYTVHHAKIAAVMVLAALAVLAVGSPAFCVGLGLALGGMVIGQRGQP
jgi:hypothetical protein